MNILVIETSPHKKGSSNMLADAFMKGAREAGHKVTVFDSGHAKIEGCLGCGACGMSGPCVQKDDMKELREKILNADMTVFVTPLYYFGFSAQLKKVIDRFYAFNTQLSSKHMKTALIVAAWDSNDWTMKDIQSHYETLCRYLHFENVGEVLGTGCGSPSMTERSPFMNTAYTLGKSI